MALLGWEDGAPERGSGSAAVLVALGVPRGWSLVRVLASMG